MGGVKVEQGLVLDEGTAQNASFEPGRGFDIDHVLNGRVDTEWFEWSAHLGFQCEFCGGVARHVRRGGWL